jgi:hypothetical protein
MVLIKSVLNFNPLTVKIYRKEISVNRLKCPGLVNMLFLPLTLNTEKVIFDWMYKNPINMRKRQIFPVVLPLLFLFSQSVSGITIASNFCEKALTGISQPLLYTANLIEVHKLSSEINNGKSCEYPLYVSEMNSGIIYLAELKSADNVSTTQEFYFSKYDSTTSSWVKPINIMKDYAKFSEENKIMNFDEIFITIDNDIYRVDLKNKTFSPQKLNFNTKSIETSPTLSPDGSTLYFISDRKGSYGGKDVWASERLSNGNWSEPYNLGKEVNTAEDEESPFMMSDGVTMYFSSKGHSSFGGFDIYMTTLNDEGFWSEPENLGAPVNSTSNDYFYITDSFGNMAYYSSDKLEKDNQDIFFVKYNSFGR